MPESYFSSRKVIAYCLAIMSVATAVIHFAVAGQHFQEYWMYGVFMLVVAWLQLLWAIVAITRPSRLLLCGGLILNVGVVAVYVVTRTIGDVVGPGANSAEQAGFGDLLCTVLEAIVAAGCAWLLVAKADHRVGRQHLVMRSRYADAAARLVLEPLGMSDSSFPGRWPGPGAVTGYQVSRDMAFVPAPAVDCAIPAADGMWTTAADLVRFGTLWPSLLPGALAREAVRPQAVRPQAVRPQAASGPDGFHIGLGWPIGQHGHIAGMSGGCPGAFASLLVRDPAQRGGNVAHAALTNRRLPILDVNVRVLRACAEHASALQVTVAAAAIRVPPVALSVMDDEFQISYEGVALGVPVLTRDGEQFGILEHVLAVEEEDIFEGIVVWVGGGGWAKRKIQRELSMGHQSAARFLETFRHNDLRFVEADKVAMITVGYIRCDLDRSQAALLQPPSGAPVFYANAIDQAGRNHTYGTMFGRARWRRR